MTYNDFKSFLETYTKSNLNFDYSETYTNINQILTIKNNKIVSIGQYDFDFWRNRNRIANFDNVLADFAIEIKKYINQTRKNKPSVEYIVKDNMLNWAVY